MGLFGCNHDWKRNEVSEGDGYFRDDTHKCAKCGKSEKHDFYLLPKTVEANTNLRDAHYGRTTYLYQCRSCDFCERR